MPSAMGSMGGPAPAGSSMGSGAGMLGGDFAETGPKSGGMDNFSALAEMGGFPGGKEEQKAAPARPVSGALG